MAFTTKAKMSFLSLSAEHTVFKARKKETEDDSVSLEVQSMFASHDFQRSVL